MTATTKLFAAITFTFTAALLSMGCETVIATEDQAILGDACNPAEIAGVLDLHRNVIDHTDAEFGQFEIQPAVIERGMLTVEKMELVLDELCVDVRRPDALNTSPLPGRQYRSDALDILAEAAPATGEMHDDNVMKSARCGDGTDNRCDGPDKPHGLDLDNRTRSNSGFDPKPTRDFDGSGRSIDRDFTAQVQEPGKPHADELDAPSGNRDDAPESDAQCYETSHPAFGDECLICCMGVDCYMACVE